MSGGMKTLAGDTMIYGLSTMLTRMLGYLVVPYLTRVMGTGEYGVVTDLYSLIPFAMVLMTLGLERGYFRFAGRAADDGEKRSLFATAWGATLAAAALFAAVVWLLRVPLAAAMGYADRAAIVPLVGAIVTLDIAMAMPFARLREQRRRMRYVAARLAGAVVSLVLCVYFYTVRRAEGAEWMLAANLVASAVSAAMLAPTLGGLRPRIERTTLRRMMLYSLPLLISGVAGTAGELIDRQMVKWLMPAGEAMSALGVYGATTKLAVIMVLFTTMYQLAAEPFFLARFRKEDFVRQNAEATKYYLAAAVAIFLCIMLFKDAAILILGERFRGGGHLLPMLLVANGLAGLVLSLSFWYKQMGRTWVAIAVTGTGLAVTLALCTALIPRIGYEGAAWARLACEAAMVAVSLWLNQRYCRTPYDFGRMGLYVAAGGAIYAAGLWTAGLAPWQMYGLNAGMLGTFGALVVWKEKLWKQIWRSK